MATPEVVPGIAEPIKFTRNLDRSEARAIERRLDELEPYVQEAAALRRRLENVKKRLGVESTSRMVERAIVACLTKNEGRMPRHLIIRDLGLPPAAIKDALSRMLKRGQVTNPQRGYWVLVARDSSR